MRQWKRKLRGFKERILDDQDDHTPEEIQAKTAKFWAELNRPTNKKFMQEFIEEYDLEFTPESITEVEDFDQLMSYLYDFCDDNDIWVE